MSSESTPTIVPEVIADNSPQTLELVKLVKESHLEETSTQLVLATFKPFVLQVQEWATKIDALVKPDTEPTKEEAKVIHDTRMLLVKVRTGADKKRKQLKADALAFGKALDGANNHLLELITPLEEKLENAEKFAEKREETIKAALKATRETALTPYQIDFSFYNLAEMPEDVFQQLLSNTKTAHEAKVAAAAKAEADRIAKEAADRAEQERIRAENERLKKEAEEREKIAAAERAKVEKERAELAAKAAKEKTENEARLAAEKAKASAALAAERKKAEEAEKTAKAERDRVAKEAADKLAAEQAKARKEKEELERKAKAAADATAAQAKKEREAREKVEAQLKAQKDAEAKRLADEVAAKKRAEAAPDKDQLISFAATIRGLTLPTLKTNEGKAVGVVLAQQTEKFAKWIDSQAAKL